jgi:dolichyl-phosphate-mannose--protein O-mannosyl transferase
MRAALLVPLAVLALAGWFRLWGLSQPAATYWDESYYANDAYNYLGGGIPVTHPDDPPVKIEEETTWVHPPLGKWMIAFGEGPLPSTPVGWRLPSALFGLAGVLLVYLIALELWGSAWWAGLAGFLVAVDGLAVVQSRIAMLDVFSATFALAGVYLIVLVRTRGRARPDLGRVGGWFGSSYRLGAGFLLGAAVASKWSGAFALLLGGVLCAVWCGEEHRTSPGPRTRGRTLLSCFVLVPAAVYVVSYTQFWIEHGPDLFDFLSLQAQMLAHNLHHASVQVENSAPWTWPLLLHPIRYIPDQAGPMSTTREVLAVGNPALWWGFLALTPFLVARIVRAADWRTATVTAGYAAMYLPWLALARTQFIYYMLPVVPFMGLCVVAVLRSFGNRPRLIATGTLVLTVSAAAALLAPAWMYLRAGSGWLRAAHLLPGWR